MIPPFLRTAPRAFALALATLAALAVGCRPSAPPDSTQAPAATNLPPAMLAVVGDQSISVADLQAELHRRSRRGQPADPHAVLETLVNREALVARARRLGLDQSPELILAWKRLLIAELKRRELEPRLQTDTAPEPDPTAVPASTPPPASPSPAAARPTPQIRLALLRQSFHSHTSDTHRRQLRERLESARSQAAGLPAGTTGFGPLAIDYSDDQATRYQGGDLGWLVADASRLSHDPALLAAALRLERPGELTPVIEGRDGFYLARLVARRTVDVPLARSSAKLTTPSPSPLDPRTRRQQIERDFERETRAQIPIVVHSSAMQRFIDGRRPPTDTTTESTALAGPPSTSLPTPEPAPEP